MSDFNVCYNNTQQQKWQLVKFCTDVVETTRYCCVGGVLIALWKETFAWWYTLPIFYKSLQRLTIKHIHCVSLKFSLQPHVKNKFWADVVALNDWWHSSFYLERRPSFTSFTITFSKDDEGLLELKFNVEGFYAMRSCSKKLVCMSEPLFYSLHVIYFQVNSYHKMRS